MVGRVMTKLAINTAAVLFMVLAMTATICAVDYFADGCMVDGRALKEVRPGLSMWVSGERCHQFIIKTESGRRRDTHGRVRF